MPQNATFGGVRVRFGKFSYVKVGRVTPRFKKLVFLKILMQKNFFYVNPYAQGVPKSKYFRYLQYILLLPNGLTQRRQIFTQDT